MVAHDALEGMALEGMAMSHPITPPCCAEGSAPSLSEAVNGDCALRDGCAVHAGRAVPNVSRTLALCEALLGGEGALWLEDRPGTSRAACAPLRRVPAAVIATLRRQGLFDPQGWPPVPLPGKSAMASLAEPSFCAAAPLRPGSGDSFGLLVVNLPARVADSFEPDVLQAMATVLADQMAAEAERCDLRQARQASATEIAVCRDLLRQSEHRMAKDLRIVASRLSMDALSDSPGDPRNRLLDAAWHVRAVSAVHDALGDGGNAEALDAGDYLRGLAARIDLDSATFGSRLRVEVPATLQLPAARLVRLGLVATELLAGALRQGGGEVWLRARPAAAGTELRIRHRAVAAGQDRDGHDLVEYATVV